jgi:hypothetical protein
MQTSNAFEDPSQVDDLDKLLYQMPGEPPPSDLTARICLRIHRRQRRVLLARLSLSFLLAVCGTWLVLPGLINSTMKLSLPASGFSYLNPLVQSFLSGLWGFTQNTLNGLSAFQANLTQTIGAGAWLGMVVLASAALLALSLVKPQIEE